jgi:hypothetical protein
MDLQIIVKTRDSPLPILLFEVFNTSREIDIGLLNNDLSDTSNSSSK